MLPPWPPELAVTVTLSDFAVLPPTPAQVSVKVVSLLRAAVVTVPLSGLLPLQPPDAWHDVAFCVDQVRSTVLPELTWL